MISHLARSVLETLKEALPNTLIKTEEYVLYGGTRLFFDFYIPSLKVFVEVQGPQHTEFNPHFHGDAASFKASKKRDRMKQEWCVLNDHYLVCVDHSEIPISPADLLQKIEEAVNGRKD